MRISAEQRFWKYVNKDGPVPEVRPELGPCWLWTGGRDGDGYGMFSVKHRTVRATRFSYELAHGSLANGMVPDHLCRTPSCIRPDHLEAVTNRENVLRGIGVTAQNARKTHCAKGHPLSGTNLVRYKFRTYRQRVCRLCFNQYMKNRAGSTAVPESTVGTAGSEVRKRKLQHMEVR